MRKQLLFITSIAAAVALQSCAGDKAANNADEPIEEEVVTAEAEAQDWMVATDQSKVMWEGGTSGAQVYSHNGEIAIKNAMLTTSDGAVTGGKVVIDMTSIMPMDENYGEDNPKEKLVGHLMSPDFFDAENHPTAMFEVTGSEGNTVMGNLTVRGKTNPETLTIETMEVSEDGMANIKGSMTFDRQKYDVKWAHYVQDVILSDDIELDFNIMAKKA